MLHRVGCLYYLYQWRTVKQISDNEIYLLIKYIKSVLWSVAKCLSYIEEARCLKVKLRRHIQWIIFYFISIAVLCPKQLTVQWVIVGYFGGAKYAIVWSKISPLCSGQLRNVYSSIAYRQPSVMQCEQEHGDMVVFIYIVFQM